MENKLELHGIELRYVLTILLANCGTLTVADLDYELAQMGFVIRGLRSSKSISDALRWEVKAGRVHRRGRGSYGPGIIPRSTEYRIRRRVEALKERAMERQEAIQLSPRSQTHFRPMNSTTTIGGQVWVPDPIGADGDVEQRCLT